MRRNPLDGPGMGYGPAAGGDRRGSPVVTIVLALVCLVLAATLAVVLLRPAGQTAAPVVTVTATAAAATATPTPGTPAPASTTVAGSTAPSASPTPGGTDATLREDEPEGVREAASTFMRGWLEPKKAVRVRLLQVSATDSLLDRLADVDPAKLPDAKPKGALVVPMATDFSAAADRKSGRTALYVTGLNYDYRDAEQCRRAYDAVKVLVAEAGKRGYGEYRAHLDFMDLAAAQYSFNDHAYRRFCETIKDAVDPNGILSPGKQSIWPARMREQRTA